VRDEALDLARSARVELRTYHEPLHAMRALSRYEALDDLAVTRDLAERMLSMPLANDLSDIEISRIRAVLTRA